MKTPLTAQVANRIVELVRQSGLRAGAHLTEQQYCARLDVSRSPVRRAFALLARKGIVRREPNRGYFLARDAARIGAKPVAGGSDAGEELYQRVAEDCLEHRIGPEVSEAQLLRRYPVSRGGLLKALSRMSREGLVERKPGHGWRFKPLVDTAVAHNRSYRFRMAIEPAALLEPGYQADGEAFARAREQQKQLLDGGILRFSRQRIFEIGSEFHETIVRGSGNPHFLEAIRQQNRMRRFIEYRANADRRRLARQCQEHLRLLDLIESGRLQEAAAFLRKHLDVVREIKTKIDEQHERGGAAPGIESHL